MSRASWQFRFRHDETGSPYGLQDAIAAWIEAITKAGNAIPEPAVRHAAAVTIIALA